MIFLEKDSFNNTSATDWRRSVFILYRIKFMLYG